MTADRQPLDLEPIHRRVAAATPGPWTADDTYLHVNTPDGRALIRLADVLLSDDDTRDNHPQAAADAGFIASARRDVPALLGEVDQLRRDLDTARAVAVSNNDKVRILTAVVDAAYRFADAWTVSRHVADPEIGASLRRVLDEAKPEGEVTS